MIVVARDDELAVGLNGDIPPLITSACADVGGCHPIEIERQIQVARIKYAAVLQPLDKKSRRAAMGWSTGGGGATRRGHCGNLREGYSGPPYIDDTALLGGWQTVCRPQGYFQAGEGFCLTADPSPVGSYSDVLDCYGNAAPSSTFSASA